MGSGEESDTDGQTSSSEESVIWTAENEKDFLRTLGALTSESRDPKVYDKNIRFFEKDSDELQRPSTSKQSKAKTEDSAMYLRDYERKLVLERGGVLSDDEDEEAVEGSFTNDHKHDPIKLEFKQALQSDDESDDELLREKVKTAEQKKQEDDDYYEWLKGEGSSTLQVVDADLQKLKKRWSSKDLDEKECFLRDYFCEKKYEIDEEEEIPSYEDIIKEEEEEERAEQFEHKYNFRFEEPDKDFIKQFPRTVDESLRQQSASKRKEKKA